MSAPTGKSKMFAMDAFALRQFNNVDKNYKGTVINYDVNDFVDRINQHYEKHGPESFKEGYAPFCKHIFIPNFTDAKMGSLPINEETLPFLKCGYQARTEKELPVLGRWFCREDMDMSMKAPFLDIICYSKEQIIKESQATNSSLPEYDAPWGIISVKAQDVDHETPMQPITVMRNALISEGGSGVDIDREKYLDSVKYWEHRALLQ